ncbi:MAG TPA: serine/threonine-protein kinase, partial [Vicinamibacterales bacterium]|nr:serine/threonine-protein kinase [Vicinamibacterales bacterium]
MDKLDISARRILVACRSIAHTRALTHPRTRPGSAKCRGERSIGLDATVGLSIQSTAEVRIATVSSSGQRFGPYQIEDELGSGGMGTVYRARDTRLGRLVALKVLRRDLAEDSVFANRLEQEARLVAALNHPNVCTLHDIGRHDGNLFLVMELVDGINLTRRLATAREGLPVAESLAIAAQVAEALAAAHRVGIVHRDVKPANIMIAKDGVKLLDFGVARSDGDVADTLTTMAGDSSGIVGTLTYMAPEQLTGRADARTDIYALGCVLFEMLTGRRAYIFDAGPQLFAAIAAASVPPVTTIKRDIPPALSRTLTRCLARDPDLRWQSASDLADELRWIGGIQSTNADQVSVSAPPPSRRWWVVAAVAA